MIYCILDACSYIYLSKFKFIYNEKEINLFQIFDKTKFVTIKHSRTIGDEIKRNYVVSSSEALAIDNKNYSFSKYTLETLDKALFNNTISSTIQDRGEKENLCIAIDLFKDKKYSLVYLTDDKKAIGEKGHLADIASSFPYFKVWSSFDVVLFLYYNFSNSYIDYDKALDSIRDLNTFLYNTKYLQAKKNKEDGIYDNIRYEKKLAEIKEEANNRLISYIKKVNILRNLIAA